jgi:hypothetical protein
MVPGQPGQKCLQDPISTEKMWYKPIILVKAGSIKCKRSLSRQA